LICFTFQNNYQRVFKRDKNNKDKREKIKYWKLYKLDYNILKFYKLIYIIKEIIKLKDIEFKILQKYTIEFISNRNLSNLLYCFDIVKTIDF